MASFWLSPSISPTWRSFSVSESTFLVLASANLYRVTGQELVCVLGVPLRAQILPLVSKVPKASRPFNLLASPLFVCMLQVGPSDTYAARGLAVTVVMNSFGPALRLRVLMPELQLLSLAFAPSQGGSCQKLSKPSLTPQVRLLGQFWRDAFQLWTLFSPREVRRVRLIAPNSESTRPQSTLICCHLSLVAGARTAVFGSGNEMGLDRGREGWALGLAARTKRKIANLSGGPGVLRAAFLQTI